MNIANSEAFIAKAAIEPPRKVGVRSSFRSNIGSDTRDSITANATRNTAARPKQISTPCSPHAVSLALIRAYTRLNRPAVSGTMPSQSILEARGGRDSSTSRRVMKIAAMPIGRFTRKMPRQLIPLVITPPSTGPSAVATPATAPQMPKAEPRSLPWNVPASSAREVANRIAPPIPCTARDRISISWSCATPHSSDPAVKTASPMTNRRRLPYRSAREPEVSRSAARLNA